MWTKLTPIKPPAQREWFIILGVRLKLYIIEHEDATIENDLRIIGSDIQNPTKAEVVPRWRNTIAGSVLRVVVAKLKNAFI